MNKLNVCIDTGKELYEKKQEFNHGEWEKFIVNTYPFSIRTARNYMKLYNYRNELKTAKIAEIKKAYQYIKGIAEIVSETIAETNQTETLELNKMETVAEIIAETPQENINDSLKELEKMEAGIVAETGLFQGIKFQDNWYDSLLKEIWDHVKDNTGDRPKARAGLQEIQSILS